MEKQNTESANVDVPKKRKRFIRRDTDNTATGELPTQTPSLKEIREKEEPRERKRKPERSSNFRIRD